MKTQKQHTSTRQQDVAVVRVAIFTDNLPSSQSCVWPPCVSLIERALKRDKSFSRQRITNEQIEEGELVGVHVLVFPGGREQKMKWTLSTNAIQQIQTWRRDHGGGLLGICAGTVFLCDDGRRGRHLVRGVEFVQDETFHQGLEGLVTVAATDDAPLRVKECIEATRCGKAGNKEESSRMLYSTGPVLRPRRVKRRDRDKQDGLKVSIWATYTSDLAQEERASMQITSSAKGWACQFCGQHRPKNKKSCCGETQREQMRQIKMMENLVGSMPGSAAVIAVEDALDGDGCCPSRAVVFGPHPEMGGLAQRQLLLRANSWAAGGPCSGRIK